MKPDRSVGRTAVQALAVIALCLGARGAAAAYSAPLSRVRITTSDTTNTLGVGYARDTTGGDRPVELSAFGVHGMLQIDRPTGLGVQVALTLDRADVTAEPLALNGGRAKMSGYLFGGEAHGYYNFFRSAAGTGQRGHAVTAFASVRLVQASTSRSLTNEAVVNTEVAYDTTELGGGLGAMAEIALTSRLSVCPYAWFSPVFTLVRDLRVGAWPRERTSKGVDLARPLRVGADLWYYFEGTKSERHAALSAVASLIDTSGKGARELAFVVSYSF